MDIAKFPWGNKKFNPVSLFRNWEQGVWYDPSDISRYMGNLWPELVTNWDFSNWLTGWFDWSSAGGTIAVIDWQLHIINTVGTARASQTIPFIEWKTYKMSFSILSGASMAVYYNSSSTFGTFQPWYNELVFVATATHEYFNPRNFANGTTVIMDDISIKEVIDINTNATMYQDSAWTIPVTWVEQPVGLMLDKSRWLTLGSELVSNWTFDTDTTGWQQIIGTISSVWWRLRVARSSDNIGRASAPIACTIWKTYRCSIDRFIWTTPTTMVRITNNFSSVSSWILYELTSTVGWRLSFVFTATQTTHWVFLECWSGTVWQYAEFDNVTVKEILWTPAYQTTAIDRPIFKNRYNLLPKTEKLTDWAWAKTRMDVTDNIIQLPSWYQTWSFLKRNSTTLSSYISCWFSVLVWSTLVFKLLAKLWTEGNSIWMRIQGAYPARADWKFNLETWTFVVAETTYTWTTGSMVDKWAWWWELTLTTTSVWMNSALYAFWPTLDILPVTSWEGQTLTLCDVYVWEPTLTHYIHSNLPYQKVDTTTIYDWDIKKFPPYLECNGTNSWMKTNNINFSATDEINIFAWMRKMQDISRAMVVEFGNASTNAFRFEAPLATNVWSIAYASWGSTWAFKEVSWYNSPISVVATGISKISTDLCKININSTQFASVTTDQWTGNYWTYPLYLFRRAWTSLSFNWSLYWLIIRWALSTDKQIKDTEKYLAKKSNVTLW